MTIKYGMTGLQKSLRIFYKISILVSLYLDSFTADIETVNREYCKYCNTDIDSELQYLQIILDTLPDYLNLNYSRHRSHTFF